MGKLQELIYKWGELEPQKCRLWDHDFVDFLGIDWLGVTIEPHDDLEMLVQYATQQAIEARGWRWGRDPIGQTYHIVIPEEGYSTEYWEWIEGYDNLLSAYLEAIQKAAEVAG
jgi:hypothetical protein